MSLSKIKGLEELSFRTIVDILDIMLSNLLLMLELFCNLLLVLLRNYL